MTTQSLSGPPPQRLADFYWLQECEIEETKPAGAQRRKVWGVIFDKPGQPRVTKQFPTQAAAMEYFQQQQSLN
jgi:hypothetical protein